MLHTLTAQLYERMTLELEEVKERNVRELNSCKAGLIVACDFIRQLRATIQTLVFQDEREEIWFFKQEKPRFYRWQIYYMERFAIENGKPILPGEPLEDYYRDQLKYIDRFFRQHEFHYQYFKLGATELDKQYFIRGNQIQDLLSPEVPQVDSSFSTAEEYLISKFMAYELLQEYLTEELSAARKNPSEPANPRQKKLEWTGESVNLIELIYGIYETRQVNNGKADLSDLMELFQDCFKVNLNRYFRRFTEIKQRKAMSKTRYVDEMRAAINKRIDDGDAFKPRSNTFK
jgi:hypothetical protein